MSNGWIKLHRAIKRKSWYKKSDIVHLLTHILLSASHKEESIFFNNTLIDLAPGELITGRKKLSEDTGIKESRITRILDLLQREEIIEQKGTNRYRIISVLNWSKYQQKSEQPTNSKTNEKRTANEQQNEQLKGNDTGGSGEIPNSQQEEKRTANEQPTNEEPNTIQEEKNFKEEKEIKNREEESSLYFEDRKEKDKLLQNELTDEKELALLHLKAAQKMREFFRENSGAYEALITAANYKGDLEEFEEELNKFFAYYSESSYFISDSIKNPYKYVGKLQKWISNVKNFKAKNKIQNEKNRISGDFRSKLDEALEDW